MYAGSSHVAFFGFNESFAGSDGIQNFKDELDAFVHHTLSRSYRKDGSRAPRLVLASPIAMEHRDDFALPDATARNQMLAAYSKAMADVARTHNIAFVDLFTPTQRWFAESPTPLTINGVHLSQNGYKRLASLLMAELFAKPSGNDQEPCPSSVHKWHPGLYSCHKSSA